MVVHHGLFWDNESRGDRRRPCGAGCRRSSTPTSRSPPTTWRSTPTRELGNNALLAAELGIEPKERVRGDRRRRHACASPARSTSSSRGSARRLGRSRLVFPHGPERSSAPRRDRRRRAATSRTRQPRATTSSSPARPRSRHCTSRASSASTSSPPGTTRPSGSASRRSRAKLAERFGIEWPTSSSCPTRSRNSRIACDARVGPLRDQEVAAVGHDSQRRLQPPRVVERVVDRHLRVACTPDDETGAADVARGRDAGRRRPAPAPAPCRCAARPIEEALGCVRRDTAPSDIAPRPRRARRRRSARAAENERRNGAAPDRTSASRDARAPAVARRELKPIPAAPASTSPRTRSAARNASAQRDDAAQRVADDDGRPHVFSLEDEAEDRSANGSRFGSAASGPRAAVPGQLGDDHAVVARELGRELDPVRGGAAQPVDEHDTPGRRRRRSSAGARPSRALDAPRSHSPQARCG